MQRLLDDREPSPQKTLLETLAEEEKRQQPKDGFLTVRVVLLIATGIATFTLPWPVTAFLFLCWVLVMVWPHQ
jgi:hypothetical protein